VLVARDKPNPTVRALRVDVDTLERWQARGLIPASAAAPGHAQDGRACADLLDRLPSLVQGEDVEPVSSATPID